MKKIRELIEEQKKLLDESPFVRHFLRDRELTEEALKEFSKIKEHLAQKFDHLEKLAGLMQQGAQVTEYEQLRALAASNQLTAVEGDFDLLKKFVEAKDDAERMLLVEQERAVIQQEHEKLNVSKQIGIEEVFLFTPCMAPFVMAFSDFNKLLLRNDGATDSIQKIINTHTHEDDHHNGMFLRDLSVLQLKAIATDVKFLWGEESLPTRKAAFDFAFLIMSTPNSRLRLVLVEAFEGSGNAGFQWYVKAANEFKKKTGKELIYYGQAHMDLETGGLMNPETGESIAPEHGNIHIGQGDGSMSAAEIDKALNFELTDAERKDAEALVKAVFKIMIEMGDGFLKYGEKAVIRERVLKARKQAEAQAVRSLPVQNVAPPSAPAAERRAQ